MDDKLVRWNLIAGKLEALWLVLFGAVTVGYVRSGELKLFLGPGWIRFTEAFGVIMVVGGVAVLLFCRDNERDNVAGRLREEGDRELIWRFTGIVLLALVLVFALITPYFTVLEDPFTAKTVGWAALADIEKSKIAESRKKDPEARGYRDWMILFANTSDLTIYEGEGVEVTGEVVPDKRLPDGYFFLRRDLVKHCADCPESVSITCRAEEAGDVPAGGSWIEARGEFERVKVGRQNVLVLDVEKYEKHSVPSDKKIYP